MAYLWEPKQGGKRDADLASWPSALHLHLYIDLCKVSTSPLILAAYIEVP